MNRIGIIGAMAQEVEHLASLLEERRTRTHVGCTFHLGRLHGAEVVILQSGIGKVNAAIGTTLLLDVYRPEAIINTGSAGGFGEDLAIGDVVVSSEVRHHDVDAVVFGYEHGQVPQMPAAYLPDERLVRVARECVESLGEVRVVEGLPDGVALMDERPVRTPHHSATAQALIASLQDQLTNAQREVAALRHQLDVLCQRLFGKKSERVDARQLQLALGQRANEPGTVAEPIEMDSGDTPVRGHTRRRPTGRAALRACRGASSIPGRPAGVVEPLEGVEGRALWRKQTGHGPSVTKRTQLPEWQ